MSQCNITDWNGLMMYTPPPSHPACYLSPVPHMWASPAHYQQSYNKTDQLYWQWVSEWVREWMIGWVSGSRMAEWVDPGERVNESAVGWYHKQSAQQVSDSFTDQSAGDFQQKHSTHNHFTALVPAKWAQCNLLIIMLQVVRSRRSSDHHVSVNLQTASLPSSSAWQCMTMGNTSFSQLYCHCKMTSQIWHHIWHDILTWQHSVTLTTSHNLMTVPMTSQLTWYVTVNTTQWHSSHDITADIVCHS